MNRKRDDLDPGNNSGFDSNSLAKRLTNPSSTIGQYNDRSSTEETIQLDRKRLKKTVHDSVTKVDHDSLPNTTVKTSSQSVSTRKRRPRASLEESSFARSEEMSPTAGKSGNATNQSRKKSELSCVVCYGLAHGYNFDAISCESCKAFFRRNALYNTDRLKCRRNGSCEITLETRRRCKSCRLKKCFAVGMRKEWILTEEEKINKKLRIEENRKLRLATIGESSSSNDVPVEIPKTNPNPNPSVDLEKVVLDPTELSITKFDSSISTHEVIETVINAFNDGFVLESISYGWSYPLAKKVTGLCQILNMKNTTALRLISFYRRLHLFDSLNEIDKVYLVKNNLPYIFFFHSSLGYDSINDIYYEGNLMQDARVYGSEIRELYGVGVHQRCTLIMRSLESIVKLDRRIIHLALVILLFSKGLSLVQNRIDSSINNHKQVFNGQNFFVEHLWIFMEKSYGTYRSMQIFTTLISQSLLTQQLLCDIEENIFNKMDFSEVAPIMRSLFSVS